MANVQQFVATPTLTDLLVDPARISALPRNAIAELRSEAAKVGQTSR
jgi:hypothetical protein